MAQYAPSIPCLGLCIPATTSSFSSTAPDGTACRRDPSAYAQLPPPSPCQHRARTAQYTFNNAGLASANPEARHVLALRTGSLAVSSPSLAALRPMWVPPPPPPMPRPPPNNARANSVQAQSAAIAASAQTPAARPGPDLLQLNRLNLVTSDPVHAAQLQPRNQGFAPGGGGAGGGGPGGGGGAAPGPFNEGLVTSVLRSYDVISITPKSDKVFHQVMGCGMGRRTWAVLCTVCAGGTLGPCCQSYVRAGPCTSHEPPLHLPEGGHHHP